MAKRNTKGGKPDNDDVDDEPNGNLIDDDELDDELDDGDDSALKRALRSERKARREAERRAKANADKASKFDELEDEQRSDVEKLERKLADAERRSDEAEGKLLRLEVAVEKGLTPRQAKRLSGTTRDELEEDADELLEDFGGKGEKPDPDDDEHDDDDGSDADDDAGTSSERRRPREQLRPGGKPDAKPATDTDQIAERVLGTSF